MDITVYQCDGPDADAISRAAAELVSKVIGIYVDLWRAAVMVECVYQERHALQTTLPAIDSALLSLKGMRGLHGIDLTVPTVQVHEARQFTDTANFTLRCKDCQIGVKGEKEAIAHAKATGHANFGEF